MRPQLQEDMSCIDDRPYKLTPREMGKVQAIKNQRLQEDVYSGFMGQDLQEPIFPERKD